jgi:hypothetical protein
METPDVERAAEIERADEDRRPGNGRPGNAQDGNAQDGNAQSEERQPDGGEPAVPGWFQSVQTHSWFQPKALSDHDGDAQADRDAQADSDPRADRDAQADIDPPFTGDALADSDPRADSDPDASRPAPKKRSVFGEVSSGRPDVLTDAETVVMAIMDKESGGQRRVPKFVPGAPAPVTQATPVGAVQSSAALAEAPTQLMPILRVDDIPAGPRAPARKVRWQPLERYSPTRRQTWVTRGLLLGVLALQALLSLHLHNTAFEDEALYLYSGHMELEHLLHHTALYGNFSSYFSGSPVLYPVLAAALDNIGGIALARALSLVEMLSITAMAYSIGRYLFNERAGLCGAALFSVTESAIFLGNFATYDATCLFLLAGAAWIMVFTARSRWPLFLLAAPLAALAVAVKYAGLLWVPTIAVLPPLVAWPDRLRRVWLYPFAFLAVVGALLYGGLKLGGHTYLAALQSTTTNRAQGATPVATLLREGMSWGGVVFALAIVGSVTYVWKVRTEPDEQIAPAAGLFGRAALGLVLTATALLAPAYQAHIHTDISFQKHIGFGLFFAAPMAGFGLARLMGDYYRRPHIGVGLWSLALVLAMVQTNRLYQEWPNSTAFVNAFATHLKPKASYLIEAPEVAIYYLQNRSDAQPDQFTSTYSVPPLSTSAAYAAAVKNGEFQVIAFDGDVTPATDAALEKALKADHSYYMANKIYIGYTYGAGQYYEIWVKGSPPKSAKTSSPAKAKAKKKTTKKPAARTANS